MHLSETPHYTPPFYCSCLHLQPWDGRPRLMLAASTRRSRECSCTRIFELACEVILATELLCPRHKTLSLFSVTATWSISFNPTKVVEGTIGFGCLTRALLMKTIKPVGQSVAGPWLQESTRSVLLLCLMAFYVGWRS